MFRVAKTKELAWCANCCEVEQGDIIWYDKAAKNIHERTFCVTCSHKYGYTDRPVDVKLVIRSLKFKLHLAEISVKKFRSTLQEIEKYAVHSPD